MTAPKSIPIFDSLSHPTLTGRWISGDHLDATFAALDRDLRAAGFCGACAVGLAGVEGYSHAPFLEACAGYQTLVPVAGIDPTAPEPLIAELDRVAALGFRAIKIHPRLSRFEPTPEVLGDVFRAAADRELVVFYCTYQHTHVELYPAADPFYSLVGGLKHSPGVKVVLLHGGDVRVLQYAELVRFNPDLLLDLSFTLLKYRGSSLDADLSYLFRELDRRICIGADHPEFTHRRLRERFDELATGLAEEKAHNIAHRNLEAFLGRADDAPCAMTEDEKQRVLAAYSERLAQHGYSPRVLGWPKARHRLRYFILLSQWKLTGTEILDFGCGFGDMYEYCREQGLEVSYEGVDINPDLIAEGLRQHPSARLLVRDAFRDGLERDYDYVFSSGVHNIRLADNWSFIEASFALFHRHARRGFAVNFLSDKVDYRLEQAYHANPGRIVELAYRFSNRVTLRNDYMPFEFTIFVDKDEAFDPAFAVYNEFIGRL